MVFLKSDNVWFQEDLWIKSKKREQEKNVLCRICKLRSFLNQDSTVPSQRIFNKVLKLLWNQLNKSQICISNSLINYWRIMKKDIGISVFTIYIHSHKSRWYKKNNKFKKASTHKSGQEKGPEYILVTYLVGPSHRPLYHFHI